MIKPELGKCCGVSFEPRRPEDNHIIIRLLIEDDEIWNPSEFNISSYWIDDLLDVLTRAKTRLEIEADPDMYSEGFPSPTQFGWKFRKQ